MTETIRRAGARWRSRRIVLQRAAAFVGARVRNRFARVHPAVRLRSYNGLFDREAVGSLATERRRLEVFDVSLWSALNDARLFGQIVFEYGTLINAVDDWRGLRVLDVGTGRSTLPHWMAAQGARVVSFELPERHEPKAAGLLGRVDRRAHAAAHVVELHGSMRALPCADDAFDLVTSFSVVEHLDTDLPSRAYVPYPEQRRRLKEVLDEMVRVTRPGGLLYLTSECCDYARATTDAWRPAYYCADAPSLSGAWPVEDVEQLFYEYLGSHGCTPVGSVTFDPSAIERTRHQSFRGAFFSAFSVLYRKNGGPAGREAGLSGPGPRRPS
jgi:SAM-dependent methyltransferase